MISQRTPLEGTEGYKDKLKRVHYTHDAIIDLIIAEPGISQYEIAAAFGYTPAWISMMVNSDAFLAALAKRKTELIDTTLVANIEERLRTVANRSLDVVITKLHANPSMDEALTALQIATKALGFGARIDNSATQINNFVVALPERSANSEDWTTKYSPHQIADNSVEEAVITETVTEMVAVNE